MLYWTVQLSYFYALKESWHGLSHISGERIQIFSHHGMTIDTFFAHVNNVETRVNPTRKYYPGRTVSPFSRLSFTNLCELFVVCMINLISMDKNVTPKLFQGQVWFIETFHWFHHGSLFCNSYTSLKGQKESHHCIVGYTKLHKSLLYRTLLHDYE